MARRRTKSGRFVSKKKGGAFKKGRRGRRGKRGAGFFGDLASNVAGHAIASVAQRALGF